jgi:long-chain fatty acid transport protein
MRKGKIAAALVAGAIVARAGAARAAGLYFSDHGVRPLGRGGAFVAGADDIGAIWYNPAGLADAGTSVLLDLAWLHFTSDYTRQTQVVDAAGTVSVYDYPTVRGSTPFLAIPTLGASLAFGDKKEWTGAFALTAPYAAITTYPQTVDGQPSPSRYSLVSLDGSLLVIPGLYLAYKPIEEVRFGIGLEALVGTFKATTVFSASPPDRLVSAPEDSNYDAFSELKVGPIFAPSANAGVTFVPEKHVRIGVSGQLPFNVDAPAQVKVQLPSAVEFDHAYQQGEGAHVRFQLPAVFRVGIEVRQDLAPKTGLRAEIAYMREFWTIHHSIDIIPDNILLYNVTGFPSPFGVSPISLPRNFENANSIHFGGELSFELGGYKMDARAGFAYEESAIPNAYLSPMTIDLNKYTPSLGAGVYLGEHLRLDIVLAHVFTTDQTVSPSEAAVPRVNPVKGNPTQTEAVNGGVYSARADVIGVGLNYRF